MNTNKNSDLSFRPDLSKFLAPYYPCAVGDCKERGINKVFIQEDGDGIAHPEYFCDTHSYQIIESAEGSDPEQLRYPRGI